MVKLFNYLEGIFQNISLEFCDEAGDKIINSTHMSKISKILPKWKDIIMDGLQIDKSETLSTLRHIFRSLWVYYAIMNNNFNVKINDENLSFLRSLLNNIYQYHPDIFPLILLFHDLGRPINREWHSFESANLIEHKTILNQFNLNLKQNLVIYAAIKYHLLLGTIYTGESSYYGVISMYNDKKLSYLWQSKEEITILFDIFTSFTIIDIWGYDYSKIYDHYFKNYNLIRENLSQNFNKTRALEVKERKFALYNAFSELDNKNLKWRISCALRIFQFVNTRPNLTEQMYYSKIDDSLKVINKDWIMFSKSLEEKHLLIQFKYALPLLMFLASGSFKREPITEDEIVNTKLFYFWEGCCNKISKFLEKHPIKGEDIPRLWNIIFKFPRRWFINKEYISYIKSDNFFKNLFQITPIYNSDFESYFIDFNPTI